jgi:hypothetical protein
MPLRAHLSDADLRRYVAGIPRVETERHVRLCITCMHRLGEVAQNTARWERRGLLRRLVRIDFAEEIDLLLAEIEEQQRRHAA